VKGSLQSDEGVAERIDTALALLGKKPEPDYRNSIKESISAVEAVVKLLTGEKSGGIDKAIAVLEKSGRSAFVVQDCAIEAVWLHQRQGRYPPSDS